MDIETTFLPLGAFWVAFQTFQGASSFVNEMRERIVVGKVDGEALSLPHRKTMFFDWKLTMFGTISCSFLYCAVVATVTLTAISDTKAAGAMWLVAVAVFVAGVLFSLCGISDYRLMRRSLQEQTKQEAQQGVALQPAARPESDFSGSLPPST